MDKPKTGPLFKKKFNLEEELDLEPKRNLNLNQ